MEILLDIPVASDLVSSVRYYDIKANNLSVILKEIMAERNKEFYNQEALAFYIDQYNEARTMVHTLLTEAGYQYAPELSSDENDIIIDYQKNHLIIYKKQVVQPPCRFMCQQRQNNAGGECNNNCEGECENDKETR